MSYDGTELKDTPFVGIWKRGVRIVENGGIAEVNNNDKRDYWCRDGRRRIRMHTMTCTTQKDGWMCQCESYRLGHKVCQHMMAAFILASSGSRVVVRKKI